MLMWIALIGLVVRSGANFLVRPLGIGCSSDGIAWIVHVILSECLEIQNAGHSYQFLLF
jgi:hypothetical protein